MLVACRSHCAARQGQTMLKINPLLPPGQTACITADSAFPTVEAFTLKYYDVIYLVSSSWAYVAISWGLRTATSSNFGVFHCASLQPESQKLLLIQDVPWSSTSQKSLLNRFNALELRYLWQAASKYPKEEYSVYYGRVDGGYPWATYRPCSLVFENVASLIRNLSLSRC